MADAFIESLDTPLTSNSLAQALTSHPDSEATVVCYQLIISGKVETLALAKDVIAIGIDKGLRELGGLFQDVEGQDEAEVKQIVSGKPDTLGAFLGLEEMRRRLDTWSIICPPPISDFSVEAATPASAVEPKEQESAEDMALDDPWDGVQPTEGKQSEAVSTSTFLDDPWADNSPTSTKERLPVAEEPTPTSPPVALESPDELPIELFQFLSNPLPVSALEIAASACVKSLKDICQRHYEDLFPFRYDLLEAFPGWLSPSDLEAEGMLPGVGEDACEIWLAPVECTDIILPRPPPVLRKLFTPMILNAIPPSIHLNPRPIPLTPSELTEWYVSHTLSLDSLGLLDLQLAWVQHGASHGVPSLDSLGEDLSLLSRMVYDANLTPQQHALWNLSGWKAAKEEDIVNGYLSNSSPESIADDINRLVLPYLYVLESRAERAGKPSPNLVNEYLNSAILSLPLNLAAAVFQYSKATLPPPQRVIKNDLDVARLALACLYGNQERGSTVWETMSSIFECLPVWEFSGADAEDEELTSTTIDSISAFMRPKSASAPPPDKQDLLLFFHPLPFASLSRALDILDVQLESGEILARWGVEKRLGELLGATGDKQEQTELAERMVRKAANSSEGMGEDGWWKLWDDMKRLSSGEGLLKGALGTLSLQERGRTYLGGILGSGNFNVARRMLKRLQDDGAVNLTTLEEVVYETSRVFYASAESCNIHTGDMKLAYDCLSVAPSTDKIEAEKQYIEATSRLASFSSFKLTPIKIRNTEDPASLISAVVSAHSSDAYRHPDIMLDLASKLGCTTEVQKGLIWGMVGRSAVTNDDWEMGKAAVEHMVEIVQKRSVPLGRKKGQGRTTEHLLDADMRLRTDTYTLAHTIASRDDFSDNAAKLVFLSNALEICPPTAIPSILETFQKVETGRVRLDEAAKRRRVEGVAAPQLPSEPVPIGSSSVAAVQDRVLGSRTAARAAKLALDIGGRFTHRPLGSPSLLTTASLSSPFGSHAQIRSASRDSAAGSDVGSDVSYGTPTSGHGARELFEGLRREDAERVRKGARRALVRGVGWLLGADENEISGAEE